MTWANISVLYSGETQDTLAEIANQIDSTVTVTTSRKQTGSYGLLFPFSSAGRNLIQCGRFGGNQAHIAAFSFAAGVSATPTATIPIITEIVQDGTQYIHVGTDRKLYVKSDSGATLATSVTLVPTTGLQEFTVIIDAGVTDSGKVHCWIYAGDAEDATGTLTESLSTFWGTFNAWLDTDWGGDVTAVKGADLYMDDLYAAESSAAADAPHLSAYPRVREKGGITDLVPAADGTYTDFSGGYADVDETGGNDGDTTKTSSTVVSEKETYKFTGANPIPVGATVLQVDLRMTAKLTGDAKNAPLFLWKLGANELSTAAGITQTVYEGEGAQDISRPGGGSWTRNDFDANDWEFGIQNNATADVGTDLTLMPGPVVAYYTDTLPLGTAPPAAGRRRAIPQVI